MEAESNKQLPVLIGKNVILRPIKKEDISNIRRWLSDPEIQQYLITRPEYITNLETLYRRYSKDKSIVLYAIIEKASERLIGTIHL